MAWQIETDDDVERVAKAAGWDNRRYMTPTDYAIWCNRMRDFVRIAVDVPQPFVPPAQPAERVPDGWLDEAGRLYDAVKAFPEKRGNPVLVGWDGFEGLLLLRNHVGNLLAASSAPSEGGKGVEG